MNTVLPAKRLLFFPLGRKKELKAEFEKAAVPQLSRLYSAAFYLTRERSEAEDLVQETYLRAFRFFDKFQPGTNCRAWLLSIMRHLFINRYRQSRREPENVDWDRIDQVYASMVEGEGGQRGNPESFLFAHALDSEVEQTLKELPEEYRMAVVLVDLEELTYEEAAKAMECPVGTVRSRLSRARRLLQVVLRDYARRRGLIHEE